MVAPDGTRMAKTGVTWKLERIESDYQWYRTDGRWTYELVTNASRVAGGTVDFTADQPTAIEAPTDWGQYRLTVEDDGDNPAATSVEFYAGWYRAVSSSDTPDTLQVALDKPAYRIGDTAKLRLDPRFAGIALISVIDDRLIAMKAVEVPEGGTTVDLTVTDKWGPGAYVTATLYRPMDIAAKRMPSRALGLTWAKVDPGDRDLQGHGRPAGGDAPARADDDSGLHRQSQAGRGGLCHRRRGRCRHPQPHQLQGAGAGRLVFRPAQARHGDPRHLRPPDRPHARRARRRALRRRRRHDAAQGAAADPEAARLLFRHRQGRRQRQGVGHLRPAGLQRHRAGHGHGLVEGRRRPCQQGRLRPRSGGGDGVDPALPGDRRHLAPAGRDQQRLRRCRRLQALDRDRRGHRLPGREMPSAR